MTDRRRGGLRPAGRRGSGALGQPAAHTWPAGASLVRWSV